MTNNTVQESRFSESLGLVNSAIRMITDSNQVLPPYAADTRKRDEKLLEFARSDSLLSSVLAYAVARQKAAPWLLTGAARQVSVYSRMLHRAHKKGWRTWLSMQATAYYSTNIGFLSEIIKNENNIPSDIYGIDSTRCRLTSNLDLPVVYYPRNGSNIKLAHEDILHGNSMPSLEEKMNYAGFCATERALNFVRMSLAILNNHLEKMGVAPAKGILLGKGIRPIDWERANKQYKEDKANNNGSIYDGVMALLTANSEADLELVPLSQLPEQFDIVKYSETLVNGICAAYGVPPFNVWALSTGSFGRGAEAQVSNQEASRSGAMEFISAMQEELSTKVLPATVSFGFDLSGSAIKKIINENQGERIKQIKDLYEAKNEVSYKNTVGALEITKAALEEKQKALTENDSDTVKKDIERALEFITREVDNVKKNGEGLIDRSEARQLLAAENFIPQAWTDTEEDVTVTDIQIARELAKENPRIREAANYYHKEPIVQLLGNISSEAEYRSVKTYNSPEYLYPVDSRIVTLFETGDELLKRKYY